MYVLVIEPDTLLGQLYGKALLAAGHEVQVVQTAQAAIAVADRRQPDVVVLEPMMPRHNGIEFLYEFKSYSEWQHIPVVIQTVISPEKLTKASVLGNELGVVAVLDKAATSLEALCQAVETARKHNSA